MSNIQPRPTNLTEEQNSLWDSYNIYKVRNNDSTVVYYGLSDYFKDNEDKKIIDMTKDLGLHRDTVRKQLVLNGYEKQETYKPQPFEISVKLEHPLESYSITNNGRVISNNAHYNIVRKTKLNKAGYPKVVLKGSDGKVYERVVHRLVANAFIPNPSGLSEVNHKDGDKLNYSINNLEWCTRDYNMRHYHDILMQGKKHMPGNTKITQEIADKVKYCIKEGMAVRDIVDKVPQVTESIVKNIKYSGHWS